MSFLYELAQSFSSGLDKKTFHLTMHLLQRSLFDEHKDICNETERWLYFGLDHTMGHIYNDRQ